MDVFDSYYVIDYREREFVFHCGLLIKCRYIKYPFRKLVNDYLLIHNPPMKRPRGRPPVENGETAWLGFRLSPERKERYAKAAAKAGETLSGWIKRVLDRASKP